MKAGKLDEYAIKARVFPAFLVLLPLGASAGQFVGFESLLFGACSAFGGTALLSFVLAQWSRDSGKKKEEQLFKLWDGKPTTRYLRHRNPGVSSILRVRRHRRLERLAQDIVLPSVRAEADDPKEADQRYDAATKVLIQRTRDKAKHSVLFQELIDYGFRRNTWGLRPTAIVILVCAIALNAVLILLGHNVDYNAGAIVVYIGCLFVWGLFVTPQWVYRAAKAYAERLFDSLDGMSELDEPAERRVVQT